MNVILLEPVEKLGEAGELVSVKGGFARNFLVPRGLALPATQANQRETRGPSSAARQTALGPQSRRRTPPRPARRRVGRYFKVRAGEDRIYGSVTSRDIADVLEGRYEVEIDRRKLELGEAI